MRRAPFILDALLCVLGAGAAFPASAQDIEPRAYSASPVGTNFVAVTYAHQTGGVLADPTVPIDDIEVSLDGTSLLVSRTFGLAGRQASLAAAFPYVWGSVRGTVLEEQREVARSGAADLRLRLAANLFGGPALAPREFAARRPATTLGASLTVGVPTGQYDSARLVNLGSNRWAFKPELGLSHPAGRWTLEAVGGVWLFTGNDAYFGGARFTQRPIATFQGAVSYTFRPRLWIAGGATYFAGGRTIVDDVEKNTLVRNSRVGVFVSLPMSGGHSVKVGWSHGVRTRIGADLTSFTIGWQYAWF
jgi:hypothetical protein